VLRGIAEGAVEVAAGEEKGIGGSDKLLLAPEEVLQVGAGLRTDATRPHLPLGAVKAAPALAETTGAKHLPGAPGFLQETGIGACSHLTPFAGGLS
jgi:hypothetical protein